MDYKESPALCGQPAVAELTMLPSCILHIPQMNEKVFHLLFHTNVMPGLGKSIKQLCYTMEN